MYITGAINGHKPSIADINAKTFAISTTGSIFVKNDRIKGADRPLIDPTDAPEKENVLLLVHKDRFQTNKMISIYAEASNKQ